MEAASVAHGAHDDHHHGPPAANQSSRVETQLLGMMLFIISEIMVFGAFFTAYFFIRVVHNGQAAPHWFPISGHDLPKLVAGVNTAILISSSFTMHWAQTSIKNGNRNGLKAGILSTFLLGSTFLFRESLELGYQINPVVSVSAILDHISNANLAKRNAGITNAGARFGVKF